MSALVRDAAVRRARWPTGRPTVGGAMALVLLAGLLIPALAAPLLAPEPNAQNLTVVLRPPSVAHDFGTDNLGRDVLARMLWGGRASLLVGLLAATLSLVVGVAVGALAGFYRGWVESVLMRLVDYLLTIPPFFFILVVVAIHGSSLWTTSVVIGLTLWPSTARLVRAEFLTIREREFVLAARSVGLGAVRLILTEILPNTVQAAVAQTALTAARAILIEAGLGFLGLSDPQTIGWGGMMSEGLRATMSAWWVLVFPGLGIFLLVLAFNLLGDWLNDLLNPDVDAVATLA